MIESDRKNSEIFRPFSQIETKDIAHASPEAMVFCECDPSEVDCTVERWKSCRRRIERDAEECRRGTSLH
jgi:hypothetical protein